MQDRVKFRLRGREVSRVEAFSDVVFGFALTLIVVSLEVPTSYAELMNTMRGLPAFAICFALLTWVRSEERRVGKECSSRRWPYQKTEKLEMHHTRRLSCITKIG